MVTRLSSTTKNTLCIYYSHRFWAVPCILAGAQAGSCLSSSSWFYCFAADRLEGSRTRPLPFHPIMKTLFTAEAISKGGRSGTIQSPDRLLDFTLGNPLEKGAEKRGPNRSEERRVGKEWRTRGSP